MLKPRKPVPALEFDIVGGGRWSLAAQRPQNFTMVVFYRGFHCPVCRRYTSELNGMIGEFDKRGVSSVMTSTDSGERAPGAEVAARARFLTAGIQGLRLVGKANPDRAALEDIARVMLRCLEEQ